MLPVRLRAVMRYRGANVETMPSNSILFTAPSLPARIWKCRDAPYDVYIYIYMYHRTTLNVIGHRPRNSFEIVASTKFLGVRHALKQCASMQVTWGGRFSRSLCQHYLFSKYVTREMWCIKCNKINFKGAYLYYLLTVLIIHR